jgi:hypothetical protein
MRELTERETLEALLFSRWNVPSTRDPIKSAINKVIAAACQEQRERCAQILLCSAADIDASLLRGNHQYSSVAEGALAAEILRRYAAMIEIAREKSDG